MDFEEFKTYIDSVKNDEKFKEIAKFTRMTDLNDKLDIYDNIKEYLSIYHQRLECKDEFQPDYDYLKRFLDYYINNKTSNVVIDEQGYIDLRNTLYITQPRRVFGGDGCFIDRQLMLTDGSKYISKIPLNYKGYSGVNNNYCMYAPVIATYIAKNLGVTTAEYRIARTYNGQFRVISRNFLKPNEEIINLTDENDNIAEYMKKMKEALQLRKYSENEINNTEFEFLKQQFIAKLIDLKDQTSANLPLIHSIDSDGNKHIKMSPMIDFDYSFHIGEIRDDMPVITMSNGKEDIASLIREFKSYPGFEQFISESIEKLDMKKIYNEIYEATKIEKFKDYEDNNEMVAFMEYVNKNIEIARQTVSEICKNERGERE